MDTSSIPYLNDDGCVAGGGGSACADNHDETQNEINLLNEKIDESNEKIESMKNRAEHIRITLYKIYCDVKQLIEQHQNIIDEMMTRFSSDTDYNESFDKIQKSLKEKREIMHDYIREVHGINELIEKEENKKNELEKQFQDLHNSFIDQFNECREHFLYEKLNELVAGSNICEICHDVGIPTTPIGLPCHSHNKINSCRRKMCLSCVRHFFMLDKRMRSSDYHKPIKCPICPATITRNDLKKGSHNMYIINQPLMDIIDTHGDSFLRKFNQKYGTKFTGLFECDGCDRRFSSLRYVWKHKRGDIDDSCGESVVRCRSVHCRNHLKRKDMTDGFCIECNE